MLPFSRTNMPGERSRGEWIIRQRLRFLLSVVCLEAKWNNIYINFIIIVLRLKHKNKQSHPAFCYLPVGEIITGCNCRCSPAGGNVRARTSTVPREVPTYKQGVKVLSPLRANVSQKKKELMASRASLSMLVTLEERERLKELSRWSNGLAPRGGHTERRTVRRKQERGKAPARQ